MALPTATKEDKGRYRPEPSVLTALKTPRILTREVLAGLVVALALIPEAISFSIIAGVDPRAGLFSSFVMAVSIAFLGGRPAMITAATGAIALVIAPVARDYGLDYFIATVLLAGVFQILLAVFGVARLMRFIPRSVMVGFVNALAILIFMAQVPELIGVPWMVYPLVAVGLLIMVLIPKITKVIPAPLVSIALVTAAAVVFSINVPAVGDKGELPRSLPELFIPNVPLTWETFTIIAPFALAMALVGLMESLMTAKLVDDVTDTHSNKTRESWGAGRREPALRPVWRHGWLRDDRADHDQREGVRGPDPHLDVPRRCVPLGPHRRPRRHRCDHPHGGAGRGDDYGLRRYLRLALHQALHPAPDA